MTPRFRLLPLAALSALALAACGADTPADTGAQETQTVTGDLTDLLQTGRDITCTFTHVADEGTMEGTLYVTRAGRVAGDFSIDSPQFGAMTMHVIRDGEYGYTWGVPSETEGLKVKLEDDGTPMVTDTDSPAIDDETIDYRCSPWRADESRFVPPANVQFRDMEQMMQQMMQDMGGDRCDACESISDPNAKESCRRALGC